MPYKIIHYHCATCGEPYKTHAQALRCEQLNHVRRTVLPTKAGLALFQGARTALDRIREMGDG